MFDDSIYDGVRQIKVKRNVGIASVRVCYDFKGEAIWGSRNGGTGSFKKDLVSKNFEVEFSLLFFFFFDAFCVVCR